MAEFDLESFLSNKLNEAARVQKLEEEAAIAEALQPKPLSLSEVKKLGLAETVERKLKNLGEITYGLSNNEMTLVEAANRVANGTEVPISKPDASSGINKAIDLAARGWSGTANAVGGVVNAPRSLSGYFDKAYLSAQDIEDYRHITNPENADNIDPDRRARLDKPVTTPSFFDAATPFGSFKSGSQTKKERIEAIIENENAIRALGKRFDYSGLVDRTSDEEMAKNSTKDVNEIQKIYADADTAFENGQYIKGTLGKTQGIARDVAGIAKDLYENPHMIPGAIAENAFSGAVTLAFGLPGVLANAISHFGNSGQMVSEGIDNNNKKTGQALPTKEQLNKQMLAGLGSAALDTFGDSALSAVGSGARKSLAAAKGGPVTKSLNDGYDIPSTPLKGTREFVGKTGGATLAEGFVEYNQAPLENIAKNEAFDPVAQRVATVLAMGASGSMAAPFAATSAVANKVVDANQARETKAREASDLINAVNANDPSPFLNPESQKYSPVKASAVLYAAAIQNESDPEILANNYDRLKDVESTVATSIQSSQEQIQQQNPEVRASLEARRTELRNSLDPNLDAADYAQIKQEAENIDSILATPLLKPQEIKQLKKDIHDQKQELKKIGGFKARFEADMGLESFGNVDTSTAANQTSEETPLNRATEVAKNAIKAAYQGMKNKITSSDSAITTEQIQDVEANKDTNTADARLAKLDARIAEREAKQKAREAAEIAEAAKKKEVEDAKLAEEKAAADAVEAKRTEERAKPYPIFEGKLDFDVPTGLIQDNEAGVKAVLNRSSETMAAAGGLTLKEAVSALIPAEKANVEKGRYSDAQLKSLLREEVDAYNTKLSEQSAKPQDASKDTSVSDKSSVDTVKSTADKTQSSQSTLDPKGEFKDSTTKDASVLPSKRLDEKINADLEVARIFEDDLSKLTLKAAKAKNKGQTRSEAVATLEQEPEYRKIIDLINKGSQAESVIAKRALAQYENNLNKVFADDSFPPVLNKVRERLAQGPSTVGELLPLLLDKEAFPEFAEIIESLIKAVPDIPVTTGETGKNNAGEYDLLKATITLSKKDLDKDSGYASMLHTLLHEAVHAGTIKGILRNAKLYQAVFDLLEHVTEQDPSLIKAYGATNALEFLAEGLSNSGFRSKLKQVKPSSKVSKYLGKTLGNALDQFIGLVRASLNISNKNSDALQQLMDLANQAIKETASYSDKRVTPEEIIAVNNQVGIATDKIKAAYDELLSTAVDPEVKARIKQDRDFALRYAYDGYLDRGLAVQLEFLKKKVAREPGIDIEGYLDYLIYSGDLRSRVNNTSANESIVSSDQKEDATLANEGQLSVFADTGAKKEKISDPSDRYRAQNIFKEFFSQVSGETKGETARPLVLVKDFLSKLTDGSVEAVTYLKDKALSESQEKALDTFFGMALRWNKDIAADVTKRKDPRFYYKDPLQFLFQDLLDADGNPTGKFTVDENFQTAISFAAFSTILELNSKGKLNNAKTINKILGRESDALVSAQEFEILADAGTRNVLLRNTAGRVAYQALGLSANNNAKSDLEPKIIAALGAHVEKLLIDRGYITRKEIPLEMFNGLRRKGSARENTSSDALAPLNQTTEVKEKTLSFFKLAEDNVDIEDIVESVKMSKSVLDKLFSVESLVKMPSLEPIPFNQKTASNSSQLVPEWLKKIISKKQSEPNKLRADMRVLIDALTPDSFLRMAGLKPVSENRTHVSNRISQEATNEGIKREFNNYMELADLLNSTDNKLDQEFYLEFSIWKNNRVGIDTNGFNPQGSKLQRNLSYQPAWETKVDLTDELQVNNLLLRIAEGLGVKTDAASYETLLPQIKQTLQEDIFKDAVDLLRAHSTGSIQTFSTEQQAVIERAVAKGGENIFSLNALIALAQFEQAMADKAESVTVQLPAEVDGKVNGSMLATLLYGAAASMSDLYKILNKGGFFHKDSEDKNFNTWKELGNLDLYEQTISNTFSFLKNMLDVKPKLIPILRNVEFFTGSLVNGETGKVESEGRKLIKGPTTEIVFGSSPEKSVKNMSERFVESIYTKIEKEAALSPEARNLGDLVGAINGLLGTNKLPENATIQQLLNYRFTARETAKIQERFTETIGEAVIATIKQDFGLFIEKRNRFISTTNLVYGLYDAAYSAERATYIKEQIAAGKIAINKKGQPIHGLSKKQEKELEARVDAVLPIMHSWASLQTENLSEGLRIGKTANQISQENIYNAEVLFASQVKDTGDARINAAAFERVNLAPGAAMPPASVHSLDSAISHDVQNQLEVLNVHDAVIAGVNSIKAAAVAMNAATWDKLFEYSPAKEAFNSLDRSLAGIAQLLKNDPSPELLKSIEAMLTKQAEAFSKRNKLEVDDIDFLYVTAEQAFDLYQSADRMKFEAMSVMGHIDQYTFEGGEHAVTDAQRQAAKKALARVPSVMPESTKQNLEIISQAFSKLNAARTEQILSRVKQEKGVSEISASNAQAFQLMDQVSKDDGVSEDLRSKVNRVFQAMREAKGNLSFKQAITKVLDAAAQTEVVQLLQERFKSIPQNLWGPQGDALIESDSEWVSFFEKRGAATGKQLATALRSKLQKDGGPANVKDFNLELLSRIEGLISPKLTIRYVTPATAPEQVIAAAESNSRAWYIATVDGQDVIYVLSPDFLHSGIQTETLLHELLHAAVSRTIQAEREKLAKNPNYKSPVIDIINNLENLRKQVESYIANSEELINKYSPATQDIDELIAWGMTNTGFQRDVLSKIEVENASVPEVKQNGFKVLISNLVAILFRNSTKSQQEIRVTGLNALIGNVSNLFTEAEQTNSRDISTMLNQSQQSTGRDPLAYTTTEIYEAMGLTSPTSSTNDSKLRSLLTGIVDKLHGPAGSLHAQMLKFQSLSIQDVLAKSIRNGRPPFTSRIMASGFEMSQQELYVAEQVEATIRAAIERNETTQSYSYKELDKLFKEARDTLKPENFYKGDWADATGVERQLATKKWNFLFRLDPAFSGDRLDYLSRFAALGLASEEFNNMLGFNTQAKPSLANSTIAQRLSNFFNKVLGWFYRNSYKTQNQEAGNQRLENLVESLVEIEAKKRNSMALAKNSHIDNIDKAFQKFTGPEGTMAGLVGKVTKSKYVQNSSNNYIKDLAGTVDKVTEGRVNEIIDSVMIYRDTVLSNKSTFLTQLVSYVRGPLPQFAELFRAGKLIEIKRKELITDQAKMVLASFENNGADLSPKTKAAVSAVLLRADAQSLLASGYSIEYIGKLLSDPKAREAKIKELEAQLNAYPELRGHYVIQAKALGYKMVTGQSTVQNLMLNARNIAQGFATTKRDRITPAQVNKAELILEPLITLYAFEYSRGDYRDAVVDLMRSESQRADGNNGVLATMKLHQYLQKDSKDKLFVGTQSLLIKGFTPEVLNNSTDVKVVDSDSAESDNLELMGYTKVLRVPPDPFDPKPTVKDLYILKDAGLGARPSGMVSLSSQQSRGTTVVGNNRNPDEYTGKRNIEEVMEMRAMKSTVAEKGWKNADKFDPLEVTAHYAIPLLDPAGGVVNYRYSMTEDNKDSILERKNQFEHLLGVMAGTTFDKDAAPAHNENVIKALHDHYKKDYPTRKVSYVEVGPNSSDPEMREVWKLLPEVTKKDVKSIWGTDGMMVRNDMLHLAFGYRKYSMADIFDKRPEDRNALEALFADTLELIFANHGRVKLGLSPERAKVYAQRAKIAVLKAENVWKELVTATKEAIVIKTGVVLLGNIWSNLLLLSMNGVPIKDIARYHKDAYKATKQYQEESEELYKLETSESAGLDKANRTKNQQRILELRNSIARNPVTVLMDAGLKPSIVQDVSFDEAAYSYQTPLQRQVEKRMGQLEKISPTARKVVNNVYMTEDTPHHRMLSQATQMSDFVARYSLYQHLTTRAIDPMGSREAINTVADTFVMYDLPLPPALQYLDDTGILPFTKFFLSSQRVIINLMKEHPVRALSIAAGNNYFDLFPTLLDSSWFSRIGNNPLQSGPFRILDAFGEIMPVKMGLSLFR